MLLSTIFFAVVSGCYAGEGEMPFDYFLGPQHEELSRVIPLPFQPDDGINYRQSYEGKYGRRGERLIALLGGGVAPLSIFDASMFGRKPSESTTTTTAASLTSAESRVEEETAAHEEGNETNISSTANTPSNETSPTASPVESYYNGRKYVEIDRRNPESLLQNIIPQESYNMSPDGVIYKRLYGAVWNFGEKGLQRRFPPSFLPSSWPFLPSPFNPPSSPIFNEETSKSESAYAGPGEPSIILQSYSYER